jgi:hypothetical protein
MNSIDQLKGLIIELRGAILLMCDDLDSSNDALDKETIRRAILMEEERLRDLIALHENIENKTQ